MNTLLKLTKLDDSFVLIGVESIIDAKGYLTTKMSCVQKYKVGAAWLKQTM